MIDLQKELYFCGEQKLVLRAQKSFFMKSKIGTILLLCFFGTISFAQSSGARFSLITCSPSAEVYATFGHSALRFQNPETQSDIVFNYGIFRFNDNFLFNFVKGETYYELGVQQFDYFLNDYASENRGMIEQELNLNPQEVQKLYDFLCENYEPQNRKYLYNFFYDNCASRPRDVLNSLFNGNLQWGELPQNSASDSLWIGTVHSHLTQEKATYRSLIHSYASSNSWLQNGIDFALGIPADKAVSKSEAMFLPDCLFLFAQNARIAPCNGENERNLVSKTSLLLPASPLPQKSLWLSPNIFMSLLAIIFIGIAILENRRNKHFYWLDSLLYFSLGVLGILLWFLSFVSIHPAVFPNIHVLWSNPLHILFAIVWLIPRARKYLRWYPRVFTFIFITMSVLYFVPLQNFPYSFVALFIIMISRFAKIHSSFSKNS